MSSITIRGCCIGAGRPKVILPIVARTEDDILREARRLSALKADCIEWRARDLPYQSRGWRNFPDAAAIR